jgi:hypothetical protein
MQDKAKQDSDLQSMSEVYAAAANNKYDLAASLMQRRIDADKEAGQPDDGHDQAILDALKSGDPVQQKGALGMIGVTLSAVTGPDKFEQTLGALTKGSTPEIREVQAGATVAERDPVTGKWKETYRSPYLKTADGGLLEADNPGGGDPSSPGAATTAAPGGFDHAVEHVLANEGGYAAHDMNGAPVNYGINQAANPGVNVKDLTKDQARQIYHDKYWVPSGAESLPANMQAPYFDVYIRNPKFAKAALARSGGDPEKFMDQADSYFQGSRPSLKTRSTPTLTQFVTRRTARSRPAQPNQAPRTRRRAMRLRAITGSHLPSRRMHPLAFGIRQMATLSPFRAALPIRKMASMTRLPPSTLSRCLRVGRCRRSAWARPRRRRVRKS